MPVSPHPAKQQRSIPLSLIHIYTNKVTFIDRSGREELPLMPKSEVAERIADKIESLLK